MAITGVAQGQQTAALTAQNQLKYPVWQLDRFGDTTIGTDDSQLTVIDVSSAGTPTIQKVNGMIQLRADTGQSEVEDFGITQGDHLAFEAADGIELLCRFRVPTGIDFDDAADEAMIGLISAYDATWDDITDMAIIRLAGSMEARAETDDGTTDDDDNLSGITLVAGTWYLLRIIIEPRIEFPENSGTFTRKVRFRIDNQTIQDADNSRDYFEMAAMVDTDYLQFAAVCSRDNNAEALGLDIDYAVVGKRSPAFT